MDVLDNIIYNGTQYEIQDTAARNALAQKQDTLISGTNIKTINEQSILGSGNITIEGGGSVDPSLDPTSENAVANSAITAALLEKADTSAVTADIDEAISGKADTSAVTAAIDAATSGKANSSDVYTKAQTSSSTEISTALESKADASDLASKQDLLVSGTNIKTINDESLLGSGNIVIEQGTIDPTLDSGSTNAVANSAITIAINAKADATAVTADIDAAVSGKLDTSASTSFFDSAAYDSGTTRINFYHSNSLVTYIDATAFIKDGMVDNVVISGGNLVITFNTDAGKEAISIPLTDIFDPSNYYTTAQTDTAIATATNDMATQTWVQNQGYLTEHQSLSAYSTTSEMNTAINAATSGKADSDSVYTKAQTSSATQISDALAQKANTASTLAGYGITDAYTKSQVSSATEVNSALSQKADAATTSSATEVATALAAKQDLLVSGTNIKTINNTSLLGSGNITIQGGSGANVVELTQAQYDALVDKDPDTFYIITDATEIDISNYYTKAQTSSSTQIATALAAKADASTTSSSTQIATALAAKQNTLSAGTGISIVNDVISVTGGGGGGTIDSSLNSSSPNAVANSAITAGFNGYTCKKSSDNGEARYFYFPTPSNPYGTQTIINNFSINGRCPLTQTNGTNQYIDKFSLVETSAITTTLDSSSTNSQVPSAKAVYDAIGDIESLLSAI